ncbi:hypothetical protein [Candidatus Ichthyocystis sparus]|uniref:hypothetical protein n=2 Tax=Candidatus Ichthyocystis sparus TaxID=1561004 RepID=UPI00114695EC|nr:hypothetical protein [Candidatus Ichthyocystis sparus]
MNPVTGVGGASPSDDGADQADSGVLQQVHTSGGGLDVATSVTAISTIAAASSVVTTSSVLAASATTSTVATTSVGKGSSGGRSDKGKGPAPKRYATGSVLTTTSVHSAPASANPELSVTTSSVTTAVHTTTADLDFNIILDSLIETARTRRAASDAADARASSAAAAAICARNRADAIPDTDPNLTRARACALASAHAMDRHALYTSASAADARTAAAAADLVVSRARAFAANLIAARDQGADSLVSGLGSADFDVILSSVVASARDCHADADVVAARASAAAAAADIANRAAADAVRARDVAVDCADPFTTDADLGAVRACARRARNRASAANSYSRSIAARAADARAAAAAADIVVAQARAFAACLVVAQDRAADDSRVPSPGLDSDPISNSSCTADVAGSSTSSLLPDSSLMPTGFVDLFGFAVSLEFSEVVDKLISEICALAKNVIYYYITKTVLNVICNLSNSERRAWCLTNGKLYELKFVSKCFAEYSSKLLPTFINALCSVKVWDSSSRSLVLLTGNRLANFWASLDRAIFKAVVGFFMSKWYKLIGRFSAPSGSVEESYDLCGGDFVNACARAGTSSSSVSRFDLASEVMRARVASYDGGSVDLFGFAVSPEVEGMVNVLISEVSVLARRTYSSVVAVPVSRVLRRLSFSEQCAWLITNMMLYKTSFAYRFFLDYCGGLCSEFICSLFRVIPGDDSDRRLLSLTGDSLRCFWISLSGTIMRVLQDIFLEEWSALTSQFSVLLGLGEESSSTVLCVGDFVSARDNTGVPVLAISAMSRSRVVARRDLSHFAEVASGSSVAAGVSVAGGVSVSATSVIDPPPPTSSESPPLFFTAEESGLSLDVVESEVLVITEGANDDVVFIDDHSSVSEGELGGRPSSSLSDEEALVVEVSTPSPSEMLVSAGEEEVEVSEVVLPIVGAAADLGVLEGESSERTVMPTTGASLVTSSSVVEVGGSSTTMPRIGSPALRIGSSAGPVAPKKSFMSRYRAGVTSSSGMSSASMSSSSIVSSGPLSSVPVAMTGSVPPLATTTGTAPVEVDIGERLAALLNRGLPPSPPPASELAPTGGEASSSTRGSGRGGRKRKRKRRS